MHLFLDQHLTLSTITKIIRGSLAGSISSQGDIHSILPMLSKSVNLKKMKFKNFGGVTYSIVTICLKSERHYQLVLNLLSYLSSHMPYVISVLVIIILISVFPQLACNSYILEKNPGRNFVHRTK